MRELFLRVRIDLLRYRIQWNYFITGRSTAKSSRLLVRVVELEAELNAE